MRNLTGSKRFRKYKKDYEVFIIPNLYVYEISNENKKLSHLVLSHEVDKINRHQNT